MNKFCEGAVLSRGVASGESRNAEVPEPIASARSAAYNEGLGTYPPVGSRGKAPGQGVSSATS